MILRGGCVLCVSPFSTNGCLSTGGAATADAKTPTKAAAATSYSKSTTNIQHTATGDNRPTTTSFQIIYILRNLR